MKRLYESLLDDEDILMDKSDDAVISIGLNTPNTNFRKLLNPYYKAYTRKYTPVDNGLEFRNKELTIDPEPNYGGVNTTIDIRFCKDSLPNFCPNIKTLTCPCGDLTIETGSRPVDETTICKTLNAAEFFIKSIDDLQVKNIEFNINPNKAHKSSAQAFSYITFNSWRHMTLSNVVINNNAKDKDMAYVNFECMPTLNNVKVNNIAYFRIYNCSLFDEPDKIWDKVFDWSYVATPASGIPRKIKDIKKLVATANNRKKYFPGQETLYKLNENFKISDLIDISGCKDLNRIIFKNNNVAIFFGKDLETTKKYSYYMNSILGINPNCTVNDGIDKKFNIPRTADGWYCVIYKDI